MAAAICATIAVAAPERKRSARVSAVLCAAEARSCDADVIGRTVDDAIIRAGLPTTDRGVSRRVPRTDKAPTPARARPQRGRRSHLRHRGGAIRGGTRRRRSLAGQRRGRHACRHARSARSRTQLGETAVAVGPPRAIRPEPGRARVPPRRVPRRPPRPSGDVPAAARAQSHPPDSNRRPTDCEPQPGETPPHQEQLSSQKTENPD